MTGVQFATHVRFLTRTNSTTLTDAVIVALANVVKDDFAKEIMKADEDLFGVISVRDLVASSTSDPTLREYSLPEDNLRVIRVEAMFDGSNRVKLEELNLAQYSRTTDENTITSQFANETGLCFYDIFRKSLWIYSGTITAVTDGLVMHNIAYPADLATGDLALTTDLSIDPSGTTSQIPRQFHELWARKISIIWKQSKDKPIPLSENELLFDKDFKKAMGAIINPNQDRENFAELPDDTALQGW